ncbi:MAG TPA: hypothetical protein VM759_04155 [Longimicrobium sp.]|nr:hypothetical protein [Longimicrobium sp.]
MIAASALRDLSERAARWRALLSLLAAAGRGRVAAYTALILVAGLAPTAGIVATGALVRAIPGAVGAGFSSPEARPALLALGALLLALAASAVCTLALAQVARRMDAEVALAAHEAAAVATLGPPGLAPLDDPALADRLQAVHDAERRGVLRLAAASLSQVAVTRLRGVGAAVVLFAFHWWAPLLLAAGWMLTNRLFLKVTENGLSFDMGDGAVRLRRAEYVRSLALEAPAAKEVRVFGLGDWIVGRYADAWLDALRVMWKSRSAGRALTAATTLALALSHAVVLGALGAAAVRGQVETAALLVFVQAVLATADLGMIGDPQFYLAQALAVAGRVAELRVLSPATMDDPASAPGDGDGVHPSPETRSAPPGDARPARRISVRLDGVRFTYRGRASSGTANRGSGDGWTSSPSRVDATSSIAAGERARSSATRPATASAWAR